MASSKRLSPAVEMRELDYLVGAFACHGEVLDTPFSARHSVERTLNAKLDLEGHWLFIRIDEKETEVHPRPLSGNWQMAFDRRSGDFVSLWTDNQGRWAEQRSRGWDGDTLAFTGRTIVDDQPALVRDTFVKESADEMRFLVDFQLDGAWIRFMRLTCRRARVAS